MNRDNVATRLMTSGGDARIVLRPETGLNRYFSAPRPSPVLAYASSTGNDISIAAFAHVEQKLAEIAPQGKLLPVDYAGCLDDVRDRIRRAYGIAQDVTIVFAPSGTDLEYVGLACTAGMAAGGTHNLLLGAEEVGSGCIHSAYGRYFAESTALGIETVPGTPVPGLGETHVEMIDIPVRDPSGRARPSAEITSAIRTGIAHAGSADRHPLVHVVHGSKTGLIVPTTADLDKLRSEARDGITFVVDACQARITSPAINDYLRQGAMVFLTGSKFMGGPPFSGMALVPKNFAERARALPEGFATIFRRAEWPAGWPGAERLADSANLGLLLRLEASVFELERFQKLGPDEVSRVILTFHQAVRSEIIERTPARRVAPYPPGEKETADNHPIEMRTLSTLDLSALGGGGATFEDAQRWHQELLGHGIRLGQPVKCVKLADGRWGATLRIGLSMPMMVERAGLGDRELTASFRHDMGRVGEALEMCAGGGPSGRTRQTDTL